MTDSCPAGRAHLVALMTLHHSEKSWLLLHLIFSADFKQRQECHILKDVNLLAAEAPSILLSRKHRALYGSTFNVFPTFFFVQNNEQGSLSTTAKVDSVLARQT